LALGIETPLSSAVSGGFSTLLSTPGLLAKQFAGQLLFAVVQCSMIFGVWRYCIADFRTPSSQKERTCLSCR
jgi:hypothetical protein